jgi:hypothetical protein
MDKKEEKQISKRRRAFLMAVGYMALALDRLEGKAHQPRRLVKSGRIRIVS